MKKLFVILLGVSVVLSSCVSQKKYSELEGNFNRTSQELVDTKAELMKCQIEGEERISALQQQVEGLKKGFKNIESGPLVRSSYHAEKHV